MNVRRRAVSVLAGAAVTATMLAMTVLPAQAYPFYMRLCNSINSYSYITATYVDGIDYNDVFIDPGECETVRNPQGDSGSAALRVNNKSAASYKFGEPGGGYQSCHNRTPSGGQLSNPPNVAELTYKNYGTAGC